MSDVEDELQNRLDNIYANDCAVLVYTVRTTTTTTFKNSCLKHNISIKKFYLFIFSLEPLAIQKVLC